MELSVECYNLVLTRIRAHVNVHNQRERAHTYKPAEDECPPRHTSGAFRCVVSKTFLRQDMQATNILSRCTDRRQGVNPPGTPSMPRSLALSKEQETFCDHFLRDFSRYSLDYSTNVHKA